MAQLGGLRYDDPVVRPHHKGFPGFAVGRRVSELAGELTIRDFLTPVLLLHEAAMDHNIAAMQRMCGEAGLSLAPHVKTTMSPEIIGRQLAAGAWAVTVATAVQARAVRALGAMRTLIANELVDPATIGWLSAQLDADDAFTGYCYVDSDAGLDALTRTLAARDQRRPLPVIVELGIPGGRTGLRDVASAVRLAERVARAPGVRLAGVGGFEGIIGGGLDPGLLDTVEGYLRTMREAADAMLALDAYDGGEFLVTAGGSAYFELVRDTFDASWRGERPIRVVLRSGGYVAHDSLLMQEHRELMAHRCEPVELRSALELWARVVSRPEPDLALLDFGKRDAGIDVELPAARHVLRCGAQTLEPVTGTTVTRLNDQHAYLTGADLDLAVGDLVGFDISHVCTTFDKWRLIPVVDAERRMVGAAQTLF